MDKSTQERINKMPPYMRPLLTAVLNKYGENWCVPYVAARQILSKMQKESVEINEQDFWFRLEEKLNEPSPDINNPNFRFHRISYSN